MLSRLLFFILVSVKLVSALQTTISLANPRNVNAKNVFLVGTFNNWQSSANPCTFNNNIWTATLDLDRSLDHQYKFIVDGSWVLDLDAQKVNDGKGNLNNILPAIPTPPPQPQPGTSVISLDTPRSENANKVFVVGDFNNWSATSSPMTKVNNKWTATINLDTSKNYQYKFIIDGQWTVDSRAAQINDGKGNINNLLNATTFPQSLPGCQTWDGFEYCVWDRQTNLPDSVLERKWQTPAKNSSSYVNTYQSYRDLTGFASIKYAPNHLSAVVTVNTFTRDPNAVLLVSFNNQQPTASKTISLDSSFKTSLPIKIVIANTETTLVLEPLNFFWQNTPVKSNYNGQKGAIVELLGWPYKDVAKECVFLGKAGYMGVKIWPVNEHVFNDKSFERGKTEFNNWYYVYQPVSYRLHNRFGTREELREMVQTCRENGIRIHTDAVLNHMTEGYNSINPHRDPGRQCSKTVPFSATAGSPFFTHANTFELNESTGKRPANEYPAVPYGPEHFHCERENDWVTGFGLQFGGIEGLGGLVDLDTGSPYVQGRIADFLVDLFSIGISGFRCDMAKTIGPNDMANIFAQVKIRMGGNLPGDFITWLEINMGNEKDLLACNDNPYNWYLNFNNLMKNAGLNDQDVEKVKIWSDDYPAKFPICGRWIIPPSRFVIQNDDHDQMYNNDGRGMGDLGSILAVAKDVNKHRQVEVTLFTRGGDWNIRNILSGYSFTAQDAFGYPDGKSDCALYKGENAHLCKSVPFQQAYKADSCGYSVIENGQWTPNRYTRVHRDMSIVNAMRSWMGLPKVTPTDIGLPSHFILIEILNRMELNKSLNASSNELKNKRSSLTNNYLLRRRSKIETTSQNVLLKYDLKKEDISKFDEQQLSPEFFNVEKEINEFYREFVSIIDNTTSVRPPTPLMEEPSALNAKKREHTENLERISKIETGGAKKMKLRPKSAPLITFKKDSSSLNSSDFFEEDIKLPYVLPSESIRRVTSARRRLPMDEEIKNNQKLEFSIIDQDLLKRLKKPYNSNNTDVPVYKASQINKSDKIYAAHTLPDNNFDSEEETESIYSVSDSEDGSILNLKQKPNPKVDWRVYSRPQSAVHDSLIKLTEATTFKPSRPNSGRPLSACKNIRPTLSPRYLLPNSSRPGSSIVKKNREEYIMHEDDYIVLPRIIEPSIIPNIDLDNRSSQILPLEWFDDSEYEIHSPRQWLEMGDGKGGPTLAFSRFFTYPEQDALDWEWLPCDVLDYDGEKSSYLVKWHQNQQTKFVKRLNLIFDLEDRNFFYKRLEKAIKRRNFAETKKNYFDCINTKVEDSVIGPLPQQLRAAVLNKLGTLSTKGYSIVDECYQEMTQDYVFSMKKATYDHNFSTFSDLEIEEPPPAAKKFARIALEKSGVIKNDDNEELFNQVANGSKNLSTQLFTANANFQKTIIMVLGVMPQLFPLDERFFKKKISFPVDFFTFKEKLTVNCELIQAKLSNEWPQKISEIIEKNLSKLFNFEEKNIKVFKNSRCNSFLLLITMIMETHLKGFVLQGLISFLKLFRFAVDKVISKRKVVNSKIVCSSAVSLNGKSYTVTPPKEINIPLLFIVFIRTSNKKIISEPSFLEIDTCLTTLFRAPQTSTRKNIPSMEVFIMKKIFTSENNYKYINTLQENDSLLFDGQQAILSLIRPRYNKIEKIIKLYSEFTILLKEEIDEAPLDDLEADISIFEEPLRLYNNFLEKIKSTTIDMIHIYPFAVDCTSVKKILTDQATKKLKMVESKILNLLKVTAKFFIESYEDVFEKILVDPGADAEQWKNLSHAIDICYEEVENFQLQIEDLKSMWDLMSKYRITMDDEISQLYWKAYSWPPKIENELKRARRRLDDSKSQIRSQLEVDRIHTINSVDAYEKEICVYEDINTLNNAAEVYEQIQNLRIRLDKIIELIRGINFREELIGDPTFHVDRSLKLLENFEIFEKLWQTADEMIKTIEFWINSFFLDLKAEEMVEKMETWSKVYVKLTPLLAGNIEPQIVLNQLKSNLDSFSRYTNLLIALLNPALREKHWNQISSIVGISLQDVQGLRLKELMALDLELVQDIVGDISKDASNDLKLDTSLEAMKQALSIHEFVVELFYDEFKVISNIPDAIEKFQDSLMQCESLLLEARASSLTVRINNWSKKLFKSQEILNSWNYIQNHFVEIYPLFQIPAYLEDMTKEDMEDFQIINKLMIMLSDIVSKNRRFITVILRSDLYEMMYSSVSRVDKLYFGVTKLINNLRIKFPRFYFLTTSEVIQILSIMPNVHNINNHISKLFEFVFKVITTAPEEDVSSLSTTSFDLPQPSTKKIGRTFSRLSTRMNSLYKERNVTLENNNLAREVIEVVELGYIYSIASFDGEIVNLCEKVKITQRVDEWLIQLESQIKYTLWVNLTGMLSKIESFEISEYLNFVPLQICYLVQYLCWTKRVAEYIKDQKEYIGKEVKKFLHKNHDVLLNKCLINNSQRLSVRNSVETLLNVNSFFMETFDGFLSCDIPTVNEMEWKRVLKYHFEENIIYTRIASTSVPYDFEYYGTRPRLVVTSATNKAFGSLSDILFNSQSPAILGPDLMQKKETLQEFATCFGRKMVTLCCSEVMDLSFLSNSLSGILSTGSFLYFESIHKASESILSIISQHIGAIQHKKLMAIKARQGTFQFNGRDFPSNSFCAFFVSSFHYQWENLPKNFQRSFRITSMLLPDLAILTETSLAAKGFIFGKKIGKRFSHFMKFLLPEIGKLGNFEIGVISFKEIFNKASKLNKHFQPTNEMKYFAESLESFFLLQLPSNQLSYVKTLIRDIFGVTNSLTPDAPFTNSIIVAAQRFKMSTPTPFITKISEIYQCLKYNSTTALIGKSMSGKSSMMKVLELAINLEYNNLNNNNGFKLFHCYPNATEKTNLSGYLKDGVWVDGVITKLLRTATKYSLTCEKKSEENFLSSCVIIDGCFDASEMEKMLNNQNAHGSSIPLNSGEHIIVPHSLRFVIETESLTQWSPQNVSNCQLIFVEDILESTHIFLKQLNTFPENLQVHLEYLKLIHDIVFTPCINFTSQQSFQLINCQNTKINNVCKLILSLYFDFHDEGYARLMVNEQHQWILATFLFSIFWVVGAYVATEERKKFDLFVRSTVFNKLVPELEKKMNFPAGELANSVKVPTNATVYDFYFDNKLLSWEKWSKRNKNANNENEIVFIDDLIRIPFFVKLIMKQGLLPLICGCSGSGKTTNAYQAFTTLQTLHGHPILLNISGLSQYSVFTKKVEQQLPIKRNKTIGLSNGKNLTILVDDLSKDSFETIPELWEIWRMWSETGGWYIGNELNSVENVKFGVVYNHSSRNFGKSKYLRFLKQFMILTMADDNRSKIQCIMNSWMSGCPPFKGPCNSKNFVECIVKSTMLVHEKICKELVKLPTNPHYVFTMRDILLCLKAVASVKTVTSDTTFFLQNWIYGVTRIYGDRMSNETDKIFLDSTISSVLGDIFNFGASELLDTERPLMSSYFCSPFVIKGKNLLAEGAMSSSLKSFKLTMDYFRISWNCGVDKASEITFSQMSEVGHYDGQLTALKIHYMLKSTNQAVLVGNDYQDRALITRLLCAASKTAFCLLESSNNKSIDVKTQWIEFLSRCFIKALELWKPIVIFINLDDLTYDFQLEDVNAILKWGWVRERSSELIHLADLTDGIRANLISMNWTEESSSIDQLSQIFTECKFVRLVLSVDGNVDEEKWWKILKSIPGIKPSSIIWLDQWKKETISYFCSLIFTKVHDWMTDFFYFIFENAMHLPGKEKDYSGTSIEYFPCAFKNSISIYTKLFNRMYFELDSKLKKATTTLAASEKLFEGIMKIENEFKLWDSQLQETISTTHAYLKRMEVERELLDHTNVEIQIDEDNLSRLSDEIKQLQKAYTEEVERSLPALSGASKSVDTVKKSDIYELKSLVNPPKGILLVMEALCLLFKVDTKPESVWENAKRLLSETKFVHNVTNFDKESLTYPMMHRISIITSHADFGVKELSNISRAVGSLAAWIVALEKYYASLNLFEPKKKQIIDINTKIIQLRKESEKKYEKKVSTTASLLQMKSAFDSIVKHKENVHKSFRECEIKYLATQEILKVLISCKRRWKRQLDDLKVQRGLLEVNCVIMSCYISFLGPYSAFIRKKAIKEWEDWLSSKNLSFSKFASLSEFYLNCKDLFLINEVQPDIYSLDNALISMLSDEITLLCDSNDNIQNWILVLEREHHPIVLSTNDPKWVETLLSAMRKEVTVVLTLYTQDTDNALIEVIKNYQAARRSNTTTLDTDGEFIEVHKGFKLYLVAVSPINNISKSLLRYCLPVNANLTYEAVNSILLDAALSSCAVGLREQRKHLKIDSMNRENRILVLDNRGMDFICQMKEEELIGGDLYRSVIENEEQYLATVSNLNTSKKNEKEKETELNLYSKISTFAAKIFKILTTMSKVPMYFVSLQSFLLVYKKLLQDLSHTETDVFFKNFLRSVYLQYVSGFKGTDQLYFTFKIAHEFQCLEFCATSDTVNGNSVSNPASNSTFEVKSSKRLTAADNFKVLPSHWYFFLNEEVDPTVNCFKKWNIDEFPTNPSPHYIRKKSWELILKLSKLPEFSKFAMEFVRFSNKATTPPTEACWEDVYRALDPCTTKFPDRWEMQLSKFERLLVIKCFRPDNISRCFEDYIKSAIGDQYLDAKLNLMPPTCFKPSGHCIPTILFTSINDDTMADLKRLVAAKHSKTSLIILSIGLDKSEKIFETFYEAVSKGRWLVIQDCHKDAPIINEFDSLLRKSEKNTTKVAVNPNFRLWLISKPTNEFAISLYSNSNKIFIDNESSIRRILENLFPIVEENLAPHEFNSNGTYRKLLLKLLYFHLMLMRRIIYSPESVIIGHEVQQEDFILSIKQLRQCFREYGNSVVEKDFCKKYFQIYGELSYGEKAIDYWDKRLMQNLFNESINIDWGTSSVFLMQLKKILEFMNKNEINLIHTEINKTELEIDPENFGLHSSSNLIKERLRSKALLKASLIFNHKLVLFKDEKFNFAKITDVTNVLENICIKLAAIVENSIFNNDLSFLMQLMEENFQNSIHVQNNKRYLDNVLFDNIVLYKKILIKLKKKFSKIIITLRGSYTLSSKDLKFVHEILENKFPSIYEKSNIFFKSNQNFKSWIENFYARLNFIKDWYNSRFGFSNSIFKGLISYDITLLFHPQAFFNAVILDFILNSRETIEEVEIESMFLSMKQTSPPERGYYIHGLYLSNACWDFSRNVIKDIKTNELHTYISCIWIQPIMRHSSEDHMHNQLKTNSGSQNASGAKHQAASNIKRNWQKYRCPIFLHKPPTQYLYSCVTTDGPKTAHEYSLSNYSPQTQFIAFLDVASDTSSKFWINRNSCLVCQM
ncbi:hypothetical protein HDU92_006186 [Lobulomyces angularis]|nr:hypothetical protein HDU92_006186 [Lobulomyces angularis]